MSNGAGSPVSADKRAEFFRDFMHTVLTLSGGSIVFSVTFLHDIVRIGDTASGKPLVAPHDAGLLIAGWVALLVGVVASLVYLFFHAISTKYERAYSAPMTVAVVFGVVGLLTGLVLLVCFGVQNLPG